MYCSKCGTKMEEDASFCHKCGSSKQNSGESVVLEKDQISMDDVLTDEQSALTTFAGDKSDYYFRKWGVDSDKIRKVSFNVPAFFFGFLWVVYRKMYSLALIILVVWLGFDALVYSQGLYDTGFEYLIGGLTGCTLGLLGNYLYYQHSNAKIRSLSKKGSSHFNKDLEKKGGASLLGLVIGIILFILYSIVSTEIIYPTFSKGEPIEFGYEEIDGTITKPSNQFEPYEEIHYSFYFSDLKGGSYKIAIENNENGLLYEMWEKEVPPDWQGVVNSMEAPGEEGEYIMKVIKNNKVSAMGSFIIKE